MNPRDEDAGTAPHDARHRLRGNVAVTGATGFIGRHVVRALLDDGWWVQAQTRDEHRLRGALADVGVQMDGCCVKLDFTRGDLCDAAACRHLLEGADVVVHVAGLVRAAGPEEFFTINLTATRQLARLAAQAGVRRFVHLSSLAAREPHLSTYARTKRLGEEAVLAELGARAVVVRPPAVYGPGDAATFGLVNQLIRRHGFVPGRPDMRFSLVHVRDLAAAVAALARPAAADAPPATGDPAAGQVLEIDDGRINGYSWRELAAQAERLLQRPVRLHLLPRAVVAGAARLADVLSVATGNAFMLSREKVNELYHPDWLAHSPLVQECTHWTPRLQFAEGLRDTLRYWRRAGRLPAHRLPDNL